VRGFQICPANQPGSADNPVKCQSCCVRIKSSLESAPSLHFLDTTSKKLDSTAYSATTHFESTNLSCESSCLPAKKTQAPFGIFRSKCCSHYSQEWKF